MKEIENARQAIQTLSKFVDKAEILQAQRAATKGWPEMVALVDPLNKTAYSMAFKREYPLSENQSVFCHISEAVFLEGFQTGKGKLTVVVDGECIISATTEGGHLRAFWGKTPNLLQACVLDADGHADVRRPLGYFLPAGSLVQIFTKGSVTCRAALYVGLRLEQKG